LVIIALELPALIKNLCDRTTQFSAWGPDPAAILLLPEQFGLRRLDLDDRQVAGAGCTQQKV